MFDELMLPDEAVLEGSGAGETVARLPIRLPWYRSLPMSSVEALDIAIDNDTVSPDRVSFEIGGVTHSLADTALLHEAQWFVLDAAQALIQAPATLSPGDHRVSIAMTLRIPYSDPDFHPAKFVQIARTARTVSFVGRDS